MPSKVRTDEYLRCHHCVPADGVGNVFEIIQRSPSWGQKTDLVLQCRKCLTKYYLRTFQRKHL